MGRFAEASNRLDCTLYQQKEGANPIVRESARKQALKDFQDMVDAIDDDFDAEDLKAFERCRKVGE